MSQLPLSDQLYWPLPRAVAWILFGDSSQLLPDRAKRVDEYALAEAEARDRGEPDLRPEVVVGHPGLSEQVDQIIQAAGQFPELGAAVFFIAQRRSDLRRMLVQAETALAAAIQNRKIVAWGKKATAPFVHPTDDTRYEEIAAVDLLGVVVVGGPLCPPSESWLLTVDELSGRADHAWWGVKVLADGVRSLFLNPLSPVRNAAVGGTAAEPVPAPEMTKVRRGRKHKYTWPIITTDLRAKLEEEGCPAPGDGGQARLEEWTASQFHPDSCPAQSTIRDKVSQEINRYRKALGIEASK